MPESLVVFILTVLTLFLMPGVALTKLILQHKLNVFEYISLGFSLILAIFFLLLVTASLLGLNWSNLQLIWLLVVVILFIAYWNKADFQVPILRSTDLLLVFILVAGALITLFTPRDEDDWSYFQIVRSLVDSEHFPALSPSNVRNGLNVWWLFHAFIVRTFDVDIVSLGRDFLPLVLVPLCFMSFYALAQTLFQNPRQASGALTLQFAFYLLDLSFDGADIEMTGQWFLSRINQDHTILQFLFLPVFMITALRYVREGSTRWAIAGFLTLLTTTAVHPQGFVQAGLLILGFITIYLLAQMSRERLIRGGVLLLPFLSVFIALIPFILYWTDYTNVPYFDLSRLAATQTEFPYTFRWVTFFSQNLFILRPDLLLHPYMLTLILLLPFLVINARRDLTGQYLLGSALVLIIVLYTPGIFGLMSRWIGWSVFRFWYLLPSTLAIIYLIPSLRNLLKLRSSKWDRDLLISVLCLSGLLVVGIRFPEYVRKMPDAPERPETTAGTMDLLMALRQFSDSKGGVVLAPRLISDAIPAYRATLTPVLFRYYTSQEKINEINEFYTAILLTSKHLDTLNKYQVKYLILPTNRELVSQFDLSAQFNQLYRNEYWVLYLVSQPTDSNALIEANTLFVYGDWQSAIEAYNTILENDPNNSLAHTGLGMLLELSGKPRAAARELQEAVRVATHNVQAHYHLAKIYQKLGMKQQADIHAKAAGQLMKDFK